MTSTPKKPSKSKAKREYEPDSGWTYAAYRLTRRTLKGMSDQDCIPVTLNVPASVAKALVSLDAIEKHVDRLKTEQLDASKDFYSARLYAAALSYVDMLYARIERPAPKGDELLQQTIAARDFLRSEVAALVEEKLLDEEYDPAKRTSSPRDVGLEVLDLIELGHRTSLFCCAENESEMYGKMFNAELLAQRLLTAVGERDAPMIVKRIRGERQRAYTLFFKAWASLRSASALLLRDEGDADTLVPALYVAQA